MCILCLICKRFDENFRRHKLNITEPNYDREAQKDRRIKRERERMGVKKRKGKSFIRKFRLRKVVNLTYYNYIPIPSISFHRLSFFLTRLILFRTVKILYIYLALSLIIKVSLSMPFYVC